jgi:GMP synthase-like glutamine amidotransferase
MGSVAQQRPLRLAILLNDTPQPKTDARMGGYGGVFKALLNASAQLLGRRDLEDLGVSVTVHDVVNDLNSYPALDDIDALLLTGSKHDSYKDDPWILKLVEYTRQALDSNRVRVIGICFGHQIIGRAVGAHVGKSNKGWEVAVTEVELTEKGKEIFEMDKMVGRQLAS